MNDDEAREQWAKQCRMYSTRASAEIDQMVSELHAMAGIREGFEDADAWEAMHNRAVQDAESQRPNSPEYAWALLRVLGVKLWMVRALEVMEEGAGG
jgi:hypothetical protein